MIITMYDVTTVGIMVADVIVKPVNAMPESGQLSLVNSIELHSGGNAMTAAINISKLGLKTALAGKLGADFFGDFLIKCLERANVTTEGIKRDNSIQTSASVALISNSGERSFLHCKGANAVFDISDIDMSLTESSNIIFVTGAYLLDNFDGEQMTQFLKKCKEQGKTTALDVCWNANGNWQFIYPVMPYVDIFMPSIDEAEKISEKKDLFEMAEMFFDKGVGSVVIKCGGDGCYIRESREQNGEMISAYKNIDAADTTGAGDSFCSGFLAAYARKNSFGFCAKFANAVGACSVMKQGATAGVRSYEETLEFMKERSMP